MKPTAKKELILNRIFFLSNKIQMLGDAQDAGLTIKQVQLMEAVREQEPVLPNLSQLAMRVGSSRQNVKKMALLLEKQGLLLFIKDVNDARALRISLTEKGTSSLNLRKARNKPFFSQLFDGFDEKQLKSLTRLLGRLLKNITAMTPDTDSTEAV